MLTRRQTLSGLGVTALSTTIAVNPAHALLPSIQLQKYKALVPEIFASISRPSTYTPCLVIGSGFGGAIAALRLAQAGQQVAVLERGSKWPNAPWRDIFSNDTLPDGRAFWHRNNAKMISGVTTYFDRFGGVMDSTEYQNMTVWRGAAVGGGSVVFTGCMIQPERRYFDAIFGGAVSYDEMNSIYYPRVRQMLRLSTIPNDVYNFNAFGHSRVWDAQARKAGYSLTASESIFNWDVVRAENNLKSKPSATVGMSNHGNSNGAKFDLNQNYLKLAEATGLAKIYPGHEVQGISWDGSRYTVDVIKRSPAGDQLDRYVLTCDKLFLAAGSVGTSELLVKAQAKGDLRNLNAEVGKGWGSNGDTTVSRSMSLPRGFTQSSPSASRLHDATVGLPITLENWYAPGVPFDIGVIGSLGMVFDQTHRGSFQYDVSTDSVKLNWAANGNDDAIAVSRIVNNRICDATGTVPGVPLVTPDVAGRNWTAHPLGGAVLNKVTDGIGRVVGHPGLYVVDGALIPGTTGAVNPSLTISALAERNLERIIASGG